MLPPFATMRKTGQKLLPTTTKTKPVATAFSFDETAFSDKNISVKRFPEPSVEWVEFVMRCRDSKLPQPPHAYDIVEGPIANDKMRAQLSFFERGAIDMERASSDYLF